VALRDNLTAPAVDGVGNPTHDAAVVRRALIELLEAEVPSEQLQAELERYRAQGHPVHSWFLSILTNLDFTEPVALRHWERALGHREELRSALGRDPGIQVALFDYFVNLSRELKNPKVVEISIYERTQRSAVTDSLTGLFNHAYFLKALEREVKRAKRYGLRVSLVMLDLDDFKEVNDTRGHREGDRVLVKTAGIILESLRESDVGARYGGEEFAMVLPDTDRNGAHVVAERVRDRVEQHFHRSKKRNVTISGGIACFPDDATDVEALLQKADEALYSSKSHGKNRITLVAGERRRHRRIPAHHVAKVKGSALRRAVRTKNLSEGGVRLCLPEAVPVGSTLSFVIKPSRELPALGLHGEVVWVDPAGGCEALYDVGLKLVGQSAEALLAPRPGVRGHA